MAKESKNKKESQRNDIEKVTKESMPVDEVVKSAEELPGRNSISWSSVNTEVGRETALTT